VCRVPGTPCRLPFRDVGWSWTAAPRLRCRTGRLVDRIGLVRTGRRDRRAAQIRPRRHTRAGFPAIPRRDRAATIRAVERLDEERDPRPLSDHDSAGEAQGGTGTMPELAPPKLSVADLFAERDTRRERERADEETLKRRQEEELAEFRKRLDTFTLTQERVDAVAERIKRAFERGETELMLTSFPSGFCTDQGRAVGNVGAPPINRPGKQAGRRRESNRPGWRRCRPACAWSTSIGNRTCVRAASRFPPGSSTTRAGCRETSGCSCPGPKAPPICRERPRERRTPGARDGAGGLGRRIGWRR